MEPVRTGQVRKFFHEGMVRKLRTVCESDKYPGWWVCMDDLDTRHFIIRKEQLGAIPLYLERKEEQPRT